MPKRWVFNRIDGQHISDASSENSSLHCDAFDLYKQARSRELAHAYAGPRTGALWEDLVFYAPEHGQVMVHIDVISRHFHYIFKRAATSGQDDPEIIPRGEELFLRVFNDCQIWCAAHLASTVKRFPYLHSGCIARLLVKQFHIIRNDDLTISHGH